MFLKNAVCLFLFIESVCGLFVLFFRTIDRSVFKPIVQIAVIENSESIDCQLLAITHAGKKAMLVPPLLNW